MLRRCWVEPSMSWTPESIVHDAFWCPDEGYRKYDSKPRPIEFSQRFGLPGCRLAGILTPCQSFHLNSTTVAHLVALTRMVSHPKHSNSIMEYYKEYYNVYLTACCWKRFHLTSFFAVRSSSPLLIFGFAMGVFFLQGCHYSTDHPNYNPAEGISNYKSLTKLSHFVGPAIFD